ncbi:MAG: hypothetical protein RMA76_18740 [Deltaproteobacteria bacterium]
MANIDIDLPASLASALEAPDLAQLALPPVGSVQVTLPGGAVLKGIPDFSGGAADDTATLMNLLGQMGPLLAALDPIITIIDTFKALQEIVSGLPFPPPEAIERFIKNVTKLVPLAIPQASILPMVRDCLALVAKLLGAVVEQLENVVASMKHIQASMEAAEGNPALQKILDDARQNMQTSMSYSVGLLAPLEGIMGLLQPMIALIGAEAPGLPEVGDTDSVEALEELVDALRTASEGMSAAAAALGG